MVEIGTAVQILNIWDHALICSYDGILCFSGVKVTYSIFNGIYYKWFFRCTSLFCLIHASRNLESEKLPLLLLQHLFSSLMTRAGQPVTHMRSTNSKPQPSNQFLMDKIMSRHTFVLVREAVSLGYTSNTKKTLLQPAFHSDFNLSNKIHIYLPCGSSSSIFFVFFPCFL